jgi:hypothetical protein
MKRKIIAAALALAALMTSGTAHARSGLILGDWRMNENLGKGFTINAETAWNYSDRGRSNCSKLNDECYKLGLYVGCEANKFELSTVTICKNCSNTNNITFDVSIDGVRRFTLKGIEEPSQTPRRSDDLGGSLVEAPLTPEQVVALSKTKASILVELTDRAPIYVEPKNGTELAFATLATACAKED